MSGRVREWLPPGAATGPRVRDALEQVVDAWSHNWFAGAPVSLSSVEPRNAGAPQIAGGWLLHADAVAVPADGPDAIRLAGLALGADTENLVLSEPDRDIIARLANAILTDLATRLAAALGRPPSAGAMPTASADPLEGNAGMALRIDDARGRALARAALPVAALASFLRANVPAGPLPALSRIDGAIGRSAACLDIRLGETRLSLGDLAQLTPGDVLVLDRTIDAGASVALATGSTKPFACAALEPDGGTTRLILTHEAREH